MNIGKLDELDNYKSTVIMLAQYMVPSAGVPGKTAAPLIPNNQVYENALCITVVNNA